MRRIALALVTMSVLLVAVPSSGAEERSVSDAIRIYTKYNNLRDRLINCRIDRIQHQMSDERRAGCRRLARYYVLYTAYGESSDYQVHCRYRTHCLPTPDLAPPANKPMPAGAKVYRY